MHLDVHDDPPSVGPGRAAVFVHAAPLAQALTQALGDLGYRVVRPATTVTLDELAAGEFALLVVDVDLCNSQQVVALVAGLVARGVDPPVVFLFSGPAPALTELPEAGVYGLATKHDLAAALPTTIGLLTRQHAARARLRSLERRHVELFDHAGLGVGELDLTTGRLVEVNRRGAALLAAAAVDAEPFVELFAPEHRAELVAALAASCDEPVSLIARRAAAPAVDVRLTLSRFGEPCPARVVVILDDVTAARRVEQRLRREQRMLAESQRISHVGSFCMTVRTGELTWSSEMYAVHRLEPTSAGPDLDALWRRLHPDDRSMVQASFAQVLSGEASVPSNDDAPMVYRLRFDDGTVRHVHGRGEVMIDADGEAVLIGTVRDVTREHHAAAALRQSEARYRSVFQHAIGGVVLADLDGTIIDANPALVSILGCGYPEQLVGTPLATWFADPEVGWALDLRAASPGRMTEARWRRLDGTLASVLLDGLVLEQSGERRFLGFVRDLTAERERVAREREAIEASQAKTAFLAGMSHELRTPLNAILGLSEALIERTFGELTDEQIAMLTTIHGSGRHLLALINDVLDIARVESGNLALDLERVRVRDPIDESLALIHNEAMRKGVTLRNRLTINLPSIELDKRRIKQVFINLLGNAVKFSPPGGEITVTADHDRGRERVIIAVADQGPGIPVDDRERVFEPFVTLDRSLTREHNGAGLGLTLVRRIVERHGGSVRVEGEVGGGSRFVVELPTGGDASAAPAPRPERWGNARPQGRPIVVLVEDHEANVLAVQAYLESHGFVVRVARDGLAGVVAATAPDVAVVLMDLRLPGLDGLEAIRRIRSHYGGGGPAILAVTAHAMPDDEARCIAAGVDGYLAKPVRLRELRERIVALVAGRGAAP